MIVLDTNVVSALMRPRIDPNLEAWLEADAAEQVLVTTTVTVMEIEHGIRRLPRGRRRRGLEERFAALVDPTDGLAALDFDFESARRAAALRARRDAVGRPSSQADMMIAGICAVVGAAVATRNVRDFEDVGLEVLDPFAAG